MSSAWVSPEAEVFRVAWLEHWQWCWDNLDRLDLTPAQKMEAEYATGNDLPTVFYLHRWTSVNNDAVRTGTDYVEGDVLREVKCLIDSHVETVFVETRIGSHDLEFPGLGLCDSYPAHKFEKLKQAGMKVK